MIAALLGQALANGQTTHIWIALEAIDHTSTPELTELLERSDLQQRFVSGAQFPDGGYAVGDGYGEIAHWEPFQGAYLAWIQQTYTQPWDEEALEHIAFWLGLAAHGMADQVFDAMYMERAKKVFDVDQDWAAVSFDEATDVAFAAEMGGQTPYDLVPYEVMVEIMAGVGHTVSAETLEDGQTLLQVAVAGVAYLATQDDQLERYREAYPWGTTHLTDPSVAGSPAFEAEMVGAYLESLWSVLHGGEPAATLGSWPRDGAYDHPTEAASADSWVSVVFAEQQTGVADGAVTVTGPDGEVETEGHLFYSASVLNLMATEDYAERASYTITVGEGQTSIWGNEVPAGDSFTCSTGPAPATDTAADTGGGERSGCGCAGGSGGWWLLALAALGGRRYR